MAERDVDEELVARALRWCADAGRVSRAAEVRAALAPLGWDELLAARALLADPPPARPLGPAALALIARGVPAEEAARREREGELALADPPPPTTETDDAPPAADPGLAEPAPRRRGGRPRKRGATAPVIRRARDRVAPHEAPAQVWKPFDELFQEEGRADLERLVREHGARRGRVLHALAATHRRGDGAPPAPADLDALLAAHGLASWFESRERDELLHALRAAGGLASATAQALGIDAEELTRTVDRLGCRRDFDTIRAAHAAELRKRATLGERVRLLLEQRDRLAGLGVLDELEGDVRARMPAHLRALRASSPAALGAALARSLGVPVEQVRALLDALGVKLSAEPAAAARPVASRPAASKSAGPGIADPRSAGPRSAGARSAGARSAGARSAGARSAGPRSAGPRSAGARSAGPRSAGARSAGPRFTSPGSAGPRSAGPRSAGPRRPGGRPAGPGGTPSPRGGRPPGKRGR